MIRYEPPQPRVALGLAALMMSAFTLGGLVVLPSKVEADSPAFALIEAADAATPAPCATALPKCTDPAVMPEGRPSGARVVGLTTKCNDQS